MDFNEFCEWLDDPNDSSSDNRSSLSELNSDDQDINLGDDIPTNSNYQRFNEEMDGSSNLCDSCNISDHSTNINEAIENLNSVSVKLKQKLFLK